MRGPETECPYCGERNNAHEPVDGGNGPNPGDVAICLYCAMPSIVANDLTVRMPTREEQAWMDDSSDVQRARAAIREVMKMGRA